MDDPPKDRLEPCPECGGTVVDMFGKTCSTCEGSGYARTGDSSTLPCGYCSARGFLDRGETCSMCDGSGQIPRARLEQLNRVEPYQERLEQIHRIAEIGDEAFRAVPEECPVCNGEGTHSRHVDEDCGRCGGTGTIVREPWFDDDGREITGEVPITEAEPVTDLDGRPITPITVHHDAGDDQGYVFDSGDPEAEPISTLNDFAVCASGSGSRLAFGVLRRPFNMTADEALRMAAWLVAMAEPYAKYQFRDVLEAVQST